MINSINIDIGFSTNITGEQKSFEYQKQIPVAKCAESFINITTCNKILSKILFKDKNRISKFEDAMRIIENV